MTARDNTARFQDWRLLPRVLCGVAAIDPGTAVLGTKIAFPVMLSPTGTSRVFHPEGERAVARAAQRAGTLYALSSVSSVSIEEIGALSSGPKCFQVYVFKDRGLTRELIARARTAGFSSLCVTLDVPVGAHRERDLRNGLAFPIRLRSRAAMHMLCRPGWLIRFLLAEEPELANVAQALGGGRKSVRTGAQFVHAQLDASLQWKDIEWIAAQWNGPYAVKGVLSATDARTAIEAGATAVMVSNHGGRQLDGAVATVTALPAVADAVGDRAEVILDGGIRRGTDVLKALSLGARACMTGRPYLYGLAAGGEAGVARALELLESEIVRGMAMLGARTIGEVTRDLIERV